MPGVDRRRVRRGIRSCLRHRWEHLYQRVRCREVAGGDRRAGRVRAERLPGHGEPVEKLQARGILLDGNTQDGHVRLLLQIFSETLLGPVFFEFIQRKRDSGFGEGNFRALFESIERDQINRGVLDATGDKDEA